MEGITYLARVERGGVKKLVSFVIAVNEIKRSLVSTCRFRPKGLKGIWFGVRAVRQLSGSVT